MKSKTHVIFCMVLMAVLLMMVGGGGAEVSSTDECTAGVADGTVTVDHRPLLWKLRTEIDVTNDLHYFVQGVEHFPGLGPTTYSFLGMGPSDDVPGPVRQGMNSQGLAVGWNVHGSDGWEDLHRRALGYYNTMSQVRTYLNDMTNLSTFNYFIDANGEASLWENDYLISPYHWEYNTNDPDRATQWIDVDNADGDDDYSTGVDVNLAGWVVRANAYAF